MSKSSAPTFRGLPVPARFFIPGLIAAAAAAVAAESGVHSGSDLDPVLLACAAVLCAAGNLFEVLAPANFTFQPNLIVFFGAAVLLPPWAVAALAVVCFVPGWLVHRFRWYMVAFNIANYTLAGMVAHTIVGFGDALGPDWSPDLTTAAALGGAAIAFVLVNHALIVAIVTFAKRRPLRRSIDEMLAGIPMDLALAMTGACLAALWATTPALVLLVIGPTLLIYRALWVPMLEHKSRTDPKTGLYNSEFFTEELRAALGAARRRDTGLAVVMIDLDQLRLINNRHGHLAGDQIIRAVAGVVSEAANEHDGIAARFGGDELCMLLPDEPLEGASRVAETVRARIEDIKVPFESAAEPLAITVSTGVAAYPEHAENVDGLLRAADAAVYDAKLGGRNRTRLALPPAARQTLAMEFAERAPQEAPAIVPREPVDASLNGHGDEDAVPLAEETGFAAEPEAAGQPATAKARPRLVPFYVALLLAATAAIGLLSSHKEIPDSPWLFVLLIGSVVVLDAVRIDVFERANLSPAAVPELALAYFFGPLGPIAAEGVIALIRAVRRDATLKVWAFDFGALSLAGTAAALVFDAFPGADEATLLLAAALAGIAYYAVNHGLLAVVMALAEGRGALAVWRERFAWMAPHYVAFGLLAGTFVISELGLGLYAFAVFGLPILMLWIAEKQYLDRSRSTVTELRMTNDELERANARLRGLLDDNQQLLGRMHRSYISTITSLARTVEAKDPLTSGHTERVADIAVLLAAELGFDQSQLPAVRVGAIIHDIGKIGIPDQILLKPGPLDSGEFEVMRKHPEMSSYIVAELELPAIVKQMVRSHHERYDGAGYPDRLTGEEIPLAARILSVADALDAMTSDRPYRKALPIEVARTEISNKAGSQFCPRVVAALTASMDQKPEFWTGLEDVPSDAEIARASFG
jgi:diguanylate cyclase (GGDEF)-like protein/putative nucleotidyltransferase with HDIG domain